MEARSAPSALPVFLPIFVANLLPLVGVAVFEWQVIDALFVYWIELGLTALLYIALIVFGQRASRPEDKPGRMHPKPVPVPRRSASIRPFERLPPAYSQNVRYVPTTFVFTGVFWLLTSSLFLEHATVAIAPESQRHVSEYASVFATAYSPGALAVAVAIFGVRVVHTAREFFGNRRYEAFSASMMAEIPCRMMTFWFLVIFVAVPVTILGTLLDAPTVSTLVVASIVVLSKLVTDWSLIQAHRLTKSGPISRWFVPNQPAP